MPNKKEKELSALPGIGPEMTRKLLGVGIDSLQKLKEVGIKQVFLDMKEKYPEVCLVHLYALQAAVYQTDIQSLSEDTKKDLKAFSDSFK